MEIANHSCVFAKKNLNRDMKSEMAEKQLKETVENQDQKMGMEVAQQGRTSGDERVKFPGKLYLATATFKGVLLQL